MKTSKSVRRYVRAVSHRLTCYRLTRFKLLSGGLLISAVLVLGMYYIQVQQIISGDLHVQEYSVITDVIFPANMTAEEMHETGE